MAGEKVVGVGGTRTVHVEHKDADGHESVHKDELEKLPPKDFLVRDPDLLIHVDVRYGMTLQPRQYEAIRIDVGLSMPCTFAERERVFSEASKWVEDKIRIEKDAILSILKGKPAV